MCAQTKRVNSDLLKTKRPNCSQITLKDVLQIDILPNFSPSGGFDNIITAIDVFLPYLFAGPQTRIRPLQLQESLWINSSNTRIYERR